MQLQAIAQRADATFRTVKAVAEGTSRVPCLVTVAAVDSPSWNGAWYENFGSNLLKKAQAVDEEDADVEDLLEQDE